jgi:hypothetical protein
MLEVMIPEVLPAGEAVESERGDTRVRSALRLGGMGIATVVESEPERPFRSGSCHVSSSIRNPFSF